MSLVLVGSTSGSVTLQEPAVAGTTVLDLPAVSGTILTTGSSGQSIPKAALPTGSVLQVVQATTATAVSTTSTSFVTTGFSATITPTSATSKILIMGSVIIRCPTGSNNYQHTIYRGATNIAPNTSRGFIQCRGSPSGEPDMTPAFQYLDSPSTTSSTTYTWYHKSEGGVTSWFAIDNSFAQLTLLEIAA